MSCNYSNEWKIRAFVLLINDKFFVFFTVLIQTKKAAQIGQPFVIMFSNFLVTRNWSELC